MAPAGPPTVPQVYAPMLVGAFLSTMLYGVVLVQSYIYYRTSKSDPAWMRLLVVYLFIAETANTIFDIGIIFEPLILKFGKEEVLVTSPLFLRADGVVTTLISTPVQIFMAWRIKVITESIIPAIMIVILALGSLSGGIFLAISVTRQPNYQDFNDFREAPALWLVTSAVADVVIAVCLVYGLSKKRTGFAVLNDQIDRIIRLTIQTGALTAIAALADAIVFLSLPDSTIFFSWDLTLSKLYTNTLLSSLNARNSFRNRENQHAGPNPLFGSSELASNHSSNTRVSRMNIHPRPDAMEMTPRTLLNPRSRDDSLRTEARGHMPVNIAISQHTMTDGLDDIKSKGSISDDINKFNPHSF